jgi:polar amino acid transport system substrate-binding protein
MQRWVSIIALGAAALAASGEAAARELQQVLNTGTLRVGVTLFAPWATRGAKGDLIGFEVDVARQLAADMGVKAEILPYDIERLIPALESGEIDVIAAGLTITPERALHVNFSQPYSEGGIALATHSAKTAEISGLDDLNAPSRKIAAVEGSVAFDLAQRILPAAELRGFETVQAASDALLRGDVDAYLEDEPVPTFLALEHPTTVDMPMNRPLLASRAAFAVNKGDPDFLAFLNAWIVAREADTWLPTTTTYWFKSLGWRRRVSDAASR